MRARKIYKTWRVEMMLWRADSNFEDQQQEQKKG